jgi:4-diphosphocytidyl-2-C-methyl-D-erythritol kinase
MHVRQSATHVEVVTPAKINLFLEVLGKRPDGFHEIETLMSTVTAYDRLIFVPKARDEIVLNCRWAQGLEAWQRRQDSQKAAHELLYGEIPRGPENLVWRAAALIRDRAGIRQGATICLVKRVPAAAGLGGASSDAAATLVAANLAWKLEWSRERLMELAAELGSDIPFFFTPGAAVARGRGEKIDVVRPFQIHVVIARPPVGLSTPQVYKACRPADHPASAGNLMNSLEKGDTAKAGRQLHNRLQSAAENLTPWISRLHDEFERHDVMGHQMSGSGSSYFALCRSARHARRIAARLKARNVGTVFAATSSVAG